MPNISLTDVTVHIDEELDGETRAKLEDDLRALEGVVSVRSSERTPHLMVVTYEPSHASSKDILHTVVGERVHAELVGM